MPQRYTVDETYSIARRASREIEAWLRRQPYTRGVRNVEDDPQYQAMDVDLLHTTARGEFKIEIKGDRLDRTGNFFFETQSNREYDTPGCFLYTQADWLYYYFVETGVLYILPMPRTREWFLQTLDQFSERETTTPVGAHATKETRAHYTTVGRLVPIEEVLRGVRGVKKFYLRGPVKKKR